MKTAWSIRTQLTLLFLLLFFPLVGLIIYGLKADIDKKIENASELAQSLSSLLASDVSEYITSRQNILQRIAEREIIRSMDPNNCDPIIKDFRDFDPNFTNLITINDKGDVVCSAITLNAKVTFKNSSNFKRVITEKKLIVGYPIFGKISKEWILPLNYPVLDNKNQLIGSIGAPINLYKYSPISRNLELPFKSHILIADNSGTILSSNIEPKKWVGSSIETVTNLKELESSKFLIGIENINNTNWEIFILIPKNEVMKDAFTVAKFDAVILIILLLTVLIAGLFFIKRIEGPIKDMVNASMSVANGALDMRLVPEGPDEIKELANQFNVMLDKRQRYELSIKEYSDHLDIAMESAEIATWKYHIETNTLSHSKNLGAILGVSQEFILNDFNALNKKLFDINDQSILEDLTEKLADKAEINIHELGIIWPDDSKHYITIFGKPIKYESNDTEYISGIIMDITDRVETLERIRYLATHDPLTQLVNRTEFEKRVRSAIKKARVDNNQHAILYMDLDQFKIVNDTCGHHAGDSLLQQLSTLFLEKVREYDTVSRLGGDEFGILLENCPLNEAQKIADKLRLCINDFRFTWEENIFSVTTSIGLVLVKDYNQSYEEIMSLADAACFMAKDKGRNCVHIHQFHKGQDLKLIKNMQLVSTINDAIENSRFQLYFQKILPISDEKLGGMIEVLLRIKNLDGKIILPMVFIPAAERYGLMNKIDEYVFTNTIASIKDNIDDLKNLNINTVCINISAASLTDTELLQHIKNVLGSEEHLASLICFEITETTAISNLSEAKKFIQEIKQIGCRFALDDFGTGMSSFSYLKNLDIDYLKIDGSFISDLSTNPINIVMVESMNKIGHVMGKKTIAEFVKNDTTLTTLQSIGMDFAQGEGIHETSRIEDLFNEDDDKKDSKKAVI